MSFSVSLVQWEQAAPLLKHVREKVFVCERRIPKRIEFDKKDLSAYHMLVCDDDTQEPIATGRLLPSGEISRIAVIMSFRQQRIDRFILEGLFKIARELHLNEVYIDSPLDAVKYFEAKRFHSINSVFMEAGLAKQKMVCSIADISHAKYYLNH